MNTFPTAPESHQSTDPTHHTLTTVYPAGGEHFDPFQTLEIQLTFTDSITYPNEQELNQLLSSNAIFYLELDAHTRRLPTLAMFDQEDATSIILIFNANDHVSGGDGHTNNAFHAGQTWTLHLHPESLTYTNDQQQQVAFSPYSETFQFAFEPCSCFGHGECDPNFNDGTCTCQYPYTPPHCNTCATGFHMVGAACVENPTCEENSCSGHGHCSVSMEGSLVCDCDEGYANHFTTMCGRCDDGYTGYPQCVVDTNQHQNDTKVPPCSEPILPAVLDSGAFLAGDGAVHIQGYYYMNLISLSHTISFSIDRPSLFRVYVEPHLVNINLRLSKVDPVNNFLHTVASSTSSRDEESIFLELPGPDDTMYPDQYVLRISFLTSGSPYYSTTARHNACENFNFELEIAPITLVRHQINHYQEAVQSCREQSYLPLSEFQWEQDNNDGFFIVPSNQPFNYPAYDIFTLNANQTLYDQQQAHISRSMRHFFFSWSFEIPNDLEENTRAQLTALLGYRFVFGDMAMLLEIGDGQSHCGSSFFFYLIVTNSSADVG